MECKLVFLYYRYNLKFVRKTSESDSDRNERCLSEQTDLESDSDEEDFVEALESLDLNQPQNMQLYTNLLEPLVSETIPDSPIVTEGNME